MQNADELERYMLTLINEDRAAAGVAPLQLETSLNASAEDHSEWMLSSDVFSHTGQGGSSATDRMRAADFELSGSWQTAENIAVQSERGEEGFRDDVEDLHRSLMNSPGHRANLLDGDLDYIGIGIEVGDFDFGSGEVGSVIVTQNFGSTQGEVSLDQGASVPAEEPEVAEEPAEEPEVIVPVVMEPEVEDPIEEEPEVEEPEVEEPVAEVPVDGPVGEVPVEEPEVEDPVEEEPVAEGPIEEEPVEEEPEVEEPVEEEPESEPEVNEIMAGRGQVIVDGTDGNDMITGGCGFNVLNGGAGEDVLNGGHGFDLLTGGADADRFVFEPGGGLDAVLDFEVGLDTLDLREFEFADVQDALDSATQIADHLLLNISCDMRVVVLNTDLAEIENSIMV